MNETLHNALNEISDRHIAAADGYRKRRRYPYWFGAVAAVLAVVILVSILWRPSDDPALLGTDPASTDPAPTAPRPTAPSSPDTQHLTSLLCGPQYPQVAQYPLLSDDHEAYQAWRDDQKSRYDQPAGYADSLADFFLESARQFLGGDKNQVYSPLNVYMALAMLAETTDGISRQQILELLGADNIDALRTQAGHVWNAHYSADGLTDLLLANSLWLDSAHAFRKDTAQVLADKHFASSFHGDLGTDAMNAQLQAWLDSQTGGLLKEQAKNVTLDPDTVFALASTIYFRAGWTDEFNKQDTADALFHCADGDVTAAFMHSSFEGVYYQGDNFGAVRLEMTGDNTMWLILPDEGASLADVLRSAEYLQLTQKPGEWERKYANTLIHLSLPKFDVTAQTDLADGLQQLGVTHVFRSETADFSPLTDTPGLFVDQINHAARVTIDEEGCIAAAFTVISAPTEGIPMLEKEIYFTLDRPFLFVVSSRDDLPLFVGTVQEP